MTYFDTSAPQERQTTNRSGASGIGAAILARLCSRQPARIAGTLQRASFPLPDTEIIDVATESMTSSQIEELLGDNAKTLLDHKCTTIDASMLHLPGPDFNERIVAESDRSAQVMRNLQQMWDHGRLGGTGYLSILPVDQGIEHSAGASFAPNPEYFDPGKDRRAGNRGRLQRGRFNGRSARLRIAQVRAPDSLHRQAQPQRVPDLSEHL